MKVLIKSVLWTSKLPKQVRSLNWLVEKIWLVPEWTGKDLEKLKSAPAKSNGTTPANKSRLNGLYIYAN